MLYVNSYTHDYIDDCRSRIASQLAAYRALVTAAGATPGTSRSALASAVDSFEPLLFSHLVLVLDSFFVHRSRTLEGKDGTPANEVRVPVQFRPAERRRDDRGQDDQAESGDVGFETSRRGQDRAD